MGRGKGDGKGEGGMMGRREGVRRKNMEGGKGAVDKRPDYGVSRDNRCAIWSSLN